MADATPSPHDAQLRQGLGWLRDHLLNHAEITFARILAADPGHGLARRLHGIALFKLGRHDEGVAEIAAATENERPDPLAWADLAVALRDAGRAEAAAQAYARAGAAAPLSGQVFSTETVHQDFKVVDYPYRAEVRYGAGRPPHPELAALIGQGRERYGAFLDTLGELQPDFADVASGGTYATPTPFWLNAWFSPLDAIALTGMLRTHRPARMIEIGSGVSTKYARRAIGRYGLPTRLTSIDPQPRNEIDQLCDEVIRQPLEHCDPKMFETLEPGDIFFLDSSHRAFQNSDVTVFFLEILPRLRPGVIVHVHDIYLPDDYIAGHVQRLWNEQYLLATALLFGSHRFEILFPSWFVRRDPALWAQAKALLNQGPMAALDLYGASFWMRMA